MENAIFNIPRPINEPVLQYAPGSMERAQLQQALKQQSSQVVDIPLIIDGKDVTTGQMGQCVAPHDHGQVIARFHKAGEKEVQMAIDAALGARKVWENMPWHERAAIFLKAADLVSTGHRFDLNAATMLNQGKNAFQAEIDAACELADFLRFNAYNMQKIYLRQPDINSAGVWNRMEYRGLEGFIFAVTPFNFTAIAGNLPATPAIMGNTVVWKPASRAVLSGYRVMEIFREAGLPDGVINFIPGSGRDVGPRVLQNARLAGVHFTGSTAVFNQIWQTVGANIDTYKTYPRIVGETGGKNFIFAHESADEDALITAAVRGAFEYQGQKCSAASRMYVPKRLWNRIREKLADTVAGLKMGDVSDFSNFVNAVIDEKSFDTIMGYIDAARASDKADILCGGNGDKRTGYFVDPTLILTRDPHLITMEQEIFGPVLTVYVYGDDAFEETLKICDKTSAYGLTGAVFARDRAAVETADAVLKHSAGNFYINDKPTGSVVGQQPFGGARKSGTNDKAGSELNLLRWTSPRTIKEVFTPPRDYAYPFMG